MSLLEAAPERLGSAEPPQPIDESVIDPIVEQIRTIDRLISEPSKAVFRYARRQATAGTEVDRPFDPLKVAQCFSLVQRLWRHRRRFPGLKNSLAELRKSSETPVLSFLARRIAEIRPSVLFRHAELGPHDPLTSSTIFWVLLQGGERWAHGANGFLAFFSIVWALQRAETLGTKGVAIRNGPGSAYLDAKCVAPLDMLRSICNRRAKLVTEIRGLLEDEIFSCRDDAVSRARLPLHLDYLSSLLQSLASIALAPRTLRSCAEAIDELAIRPVDDLESVKKTVRALVGKALLDLAAEAKAAFGKARRALDKIVENGLLRYLEGKKRATGYWSELRLEPPAAYRGGPAGYWRSELDAAKKALKLCRDCLRDLEYGVAVSRPKVRSARRLLQSLKTLAVSNEKISERMRQCLARPADRCVRVLTQQIAHASAGDETSFDPSELISALYVSARERRYTTQPRVEDAIRKALVGGRKDGSWRGGQPFATSADFGLYVPTADVVWMLSSVLRDFKEVRVADRALARFVVWLDRTKREAPPSDDDLAKVSAMVHGWPSDRQLSGRPHPWVTALSLHALLGVRDLLEFRLWQLCRQRFVVVDARVSLQDVDPTDLGLRHADRLQRTLRKFAREAKGDRFDRAEYSLILHGPPGSSKTVLTEALAREVWNPCRLIRITPADFTRRGEDRLDSEARVIFRLLQHVRGVTILFDEIDDLLRRREGKTEVRFMDLVVPAMLNRLQDLRDVCPVQEICFLFATNYIERMERALMRKGRIDRTLPVCYPDRQSREAILEKWLEKPRKADMRFSKQMRRRLAQRVREEMTEWPWQSVEGTMKSLFQWIDDQGEEKGLLEKLDEILTEERGRVPRFSYERRFRKLDPSEAPELVHELVHHVLSGCGPEPLPDRVESELRRWEKTVLVGSEPSLGESYRDEIMGQAREIDRRRIRPPAE